MKKVLSIILTLTLLAGLCGCAASKYNEAKELMESGDYAAAKEILLQNPDYEDSGELIRECDYNTAKKLMGQNEYSAAKEILVEISDYEDSAELIRECDYNTAKKLMGQNEYSAAKEILVEISDYEDSAILITQCECKAFYLDSLVGKWSSTKARSGSAFVDNRDFKMNLREDFTFTLTGKSEVLLEGECYFPYSASNEKKILNFGGSNPYGSLIDDMLFFIISDSSTIIFSVRNLIPVYGLNVKKFFIYTFGVE